MRVYPRSATEVFRGRGGRGRTTWKGGLCECLVYELCEASGVDAGADDGNVTGCECGGCKGFHRLKGHWSVRASE